MEKKGRTEPAAPRLVRGDIVPHFDVRNRSGAAVRYADIWQHAALILVCLPDSDEAQPDSYATRLSDVVADIAALDAVCVITADAVRGLGRPGALVADRWGEVVFAAHPADVSALPEPADLVEWLRFAQMKCPECEGEAR